MNNIPEFSYLLTTNVISRRRNDDEKSLSPLLVADQQQKVAYRFLLPGSAGIIPCFQLGSRNDVVVLTKRHMMKQSILVLLGACLCIQLYAQSYGGVWTGTLNVVTPSGGYVRFQPLNKIDPVTGRTIIPDPTVVPQGVLIDSTVAHTQAKIEMIQKGDQVLALLTSYGDDRQQITSYLLNGLPGRKKGYYFQGVSNLVNETMGEVPLFDLEGTFTEKEGSMVFSGIWRSQRSGNILGNFIFRPAAGEPAINPGTVYRFFSKGKSENDPSIQALLPAATRIRDSITTTAFSIDASFRENGLSDKDTLSVWLNGTLLEDNVVPGRKYYLFRAKLENETWNHLVIRCKSEGRLPGSGVLLNMLLDEGLRKYSLVLYKNDQAEWLIRRHDKSIVRRTDE
jgi:hypothetical protein